MQAAGLKTLLRFTDFHTNPEVLYYLLQAFKEMHQIHTFFCVILGQYCSKAICKCVKKNLQVRYPLMGTVICKHALTCTHTHVHRTKQRCNHQQYAGDGSIVSTYSKDLCV